jgi:hypothetical protein
MFMYRRPPDEFMPRSEVHQGTLQRRCVACSGVRTWTFWRAESREERREMIVEGSATALRRRERLPRSTHEGSARQTADIAQARVLQYRLRLGHPAGCHHPWIVSAAPSGGERSKTAPAPTQRRKQLYSQPPHAVTRSRYVRMRCSPLPRSSPGVTCGHGGRTRV